MATFKRLLAAAALAGLVAGVVLSLAQHLGVIPLLLQAEVYEDAAVPSHGVTGAADHHHGTEGWQPANGWERNLHTLGANIVLAMGFGLLLGAIISVRGMELNWRRGLLWGAGGYLALFVAPALGLPPELPGTEAAALGYRQAWWLMAVVCTAGGLWLLVFSRATAVRAIGAVLLAIPHLIGSPQPATPSSAAPAELVGAFLLATALVNAVFWLLLGGLYGFFHQRLA